MLKQAYEFGRVKAATVIYADDARHLESTGGIGIIAECGDRGRIVAKHENGDVDVEFEKGTTTCGRDELDPIHRKTYPVPCILKPKNN